MYLNFTPGKLTVTEVLEGLLTLIPIESAHVMVPDDDSTPPIHDEFQAMLPALQLERHGRYPFYDKAREADVSLVIATGEQRIYANILLIIGVIPPQV